MTCNQALAVSLLTILLSACGADVQTAAGALPAAAPLVEVDTVTVVTGNATLTQDLPGRLQAYRTAQVRARVEGIVEKRLFAEGSDVAAGAALFQIDNRYYQAAARSAQADVEVARVTAERYKSLLATKAVSQQDLDLALARLKQAETALSRAQIDLENTHVPAPLSGHIGRALVTEGALVGKGEPTHLATVEQIDPIYVNFTQPGGDLLSLQQAVKTGRLKRAESVRVELLLADGSLYALPGKIDFTDLAVDPSTDAVSVRAQFPNPKRELLPGMFVRVRFPQAVAVNTVRLPQRAVQSSPQGQFVLLVTADGKVVSQPVRTGGMADGDFIISSGVNIGDQVIVNGFQKLRPGAAVKAMPWKPQPGPAVAPPPASPAANPGASEKKQG